jgi:hypothetical protein
MPLTVEISSLPIIHNNFYFQQLIDLYPGRTFMLMNDASSDLSFKKNESYNSDEIKKLELKLFGPASGSDNVDPDNLHLIYDSTNLYRDSDRRYILINSDEQKINFVDPGIQNKFPGNYPAYSVFKAISTPRPDKKFNEIKGVYHVKTIDYRIYKDDPTKYDIAHNMFQGTVIHYMELLYDFMCNSEENTLFLIQTPSYTNGSYAINYYKIIFFVIYEQLKIKIDSGQVRDINIEKKLIFRIYGFKTIPQIDDLIHLPNAWYNEEDAQHFNDLLRTIDIRAYVEFEISRLLNGIRSNLLGVRRNPLKRSSNNNSTDDASVVSANNESVGSADDESLDDASVGSANNETLDDDSVVSANNETLDDDSIVSEDNETIENNEPVESSSEENLLDEFYQHMEDWVGENMMKSLFKTEPPEIVELETLVSRIFGKNHVGDKMTSKEKLKKIFEKFRNGEIITPEEEKEGDDRPISGGRLRTLEDFKDYIKQKIKEIVPKTVQ